MSGVPTGGDSRPLEAQITNWPRLTNPAAAEQKCADLFAAAVDVDAIARGDSRLRRLLLGIADHSPYLWRLVQADAVRLRLLLEAPPEASLDKLLGDMREATAAASSFADAALAIRLGKQASALLIALADLGGVWSLQQVTAALTAFADCCVSCALDFIAREAARNGKLLIDHAASANNCGMVVLALGKQGSGELNYSSDVDLVVFFDPASPAVPSGVEPAPQFVRMTQSLARMLQERTGEGYALRVDLRLRPDPGSTSVAIAVPAALSYYEMLGQNWERAALIKARPVAGEKLLGELFLRNLAPFIWRKYFDYAAIADIHAMKRQIHAFRGHAEIAVAGHDVKLGRGGIREVEFFVQTQQLIFGGRRPNLRGAKTLDMLGELAAEGWVTREAADELALAYVFLRKVEHRLQMIDDEQTQRLPEDETRLSQFAAFCGFESLAGFSQELTRHLRRVEFHYGRLFEHAPGLDTGAGNLVFTGVTDDPETLGTLNQLGFSDPHRAAETIRGWHFGRRPAIQSARAREVLTELVPALLESFSRSGDADAALAAFDSALTRMPAAIELFAILKSNDNVRELFGDMLGGAPRLAQAVVARPHLLDAAIDAKALAASTAKDVYAARASALLSTAASTEDFLDALRDFAQEESFLIGLAALTGAAAPRSSGEAYTRLAESVLETALAHVQLAFEQEFGAAPGGRCIVLGLGRLGSQEMTATSDLDIMLVYDFDRERPLSDGPKKLHAFQYYARLTQRLLSALTVATRRGRLYEVDMRLRPSGRKGPVATQFESFIAYQQAEAETWEHMSLCRARVIAGDPELASAAEKAIGAVLRRSRDRNVIRADVAAMRRLIAKEKGDQNAWDLKLAWGGLLDIEFITQYIILTCGELRPEIIQPRTDEALIAIGRSGLIDPGAKETLLDAHRLYSSTMQMTRLTVGTSFSPESAANGVLRRIAAALDFPDFAHVENDIRDRRRSVREAFLRIIEL